MAYDSTFFEGQMAGARTSAQPVVELCMSLLAPASVVDVGCGTGAWLAEFQAQGVSRIEGLDGDYVQRSLLQIPANNFVSVELEQPLAPSARFDLAICLEVAEHLSPDRGPGLVADLTTLAPAVLFSAAVPFQGGTDHVNERWQDYWAGLFASRGYHVCDCVRPPLWLDARVDPWYRQNTILYLDDSFDLECESAMPLRVVHPDLVEQTARQMAREQIGRFVVDAAWRKVRTRRATG